MDDRYGKIIYKLFMKMFFMLMTSLMTSQRNDRVCLLYSCLNGISTCFMITPKLSKYHYQTCGVHISFFTLITSAITSQCDGKFWKVFNLWLYLDLSVCVSEWKITHNSWMHWYIFTKFGTQMHLGIIQNVKCQTSRSLGIKIIRNGYRFTLFVYG